MTYLIWAILDRNESNDGNILSIDNVTYTTTATTITSYINVFRRR